MTKKLRQKRIKYYVDKYGQKMRGSTFSTARGWVNGVKNLTKKEKDEILSRIKDRYFRLSRIKDRYFR